MAREKMRIEWEKVLIDGEPMFELVNVSGVANPECLPYEYRTNSDKYVDKSGNGFFVYDIDDEQTGRGGEYVPGDCLTEQQYTVLLRLLHICAGDLARIDEEIVAKEKENVDWCGSVVDEI